MNGIFGSPALELLIALIFIFFLLSVITSSINEMIATLLKLRAKDLERGIANMLSDPALAQVVLRHPLIRALGSTHGEVGVVERLAGQEPSPPAPAPPAPGTAAHDFVETASLATTNAVMVSVTAVTAAVTAVASALTAPFAPGKYGAGKPSYIPAHIFSVALFDSLVPATQNILSIESLRNVMLARAEGGATLAAQDFGRALLSLIDQGLHPTSTIQAFDDVRVAVRSVASQAAAVSPLLDQIDKARTLDDLRALVLQLPPPHSQTALGLIAASQTRLTAARASVEAWFNDAMDRLSGVYKRRVQVYLFCIGLVISLILGADTIQMVRTLNANPALRQFASAEAPQFVASQTTNPLIYAPRITGTLTATTVVTVTGNTTTTMTTVAAPGLEPALGELAHVSALFGYNDVTSANDWGGKVLLFLAHLPGILITSFAITFGAPFWFDILNKITNLRGAGPQATPPAPTSRS